MREHAGILQIAEMNEAGIDAWGTSDGESLRGASLRREGRLLCGRLNGFRLDGNARCFLRIRRVAGNGIHNRFRWRRRRVRWRNMMAVRWSLVVMMKGGAG